MNWRDWIKILLIGYAVIVFAGAISLLICWLGIRYNPVIVGIGTFILLPIVILFSIFLFDKYN